jgi:histidinol-phosphate aminotransferase
MKTMNTTRAREVIRAMTAYTLELRTAAIKLNQNESPYDLPRELKEQVLARMLERPWNIYPDFEAMALREALASAYGLSYENVLVGNGSNELLAAAIATFVGPGTPVIFAKPTFALYEKLVVVAGGTPVPIEHDPATGFLPLEAMLAAIARHDQAVAIVCSPNNPTGSVLPPGGLERLLDTGAAVLFDRAYGDFALDTFPPLRDNLVTFSTFSKAWGLAALRLGWLASTAENCREVRKVKLPYSLNVISEETAVVALQNPAYRDRNVDATVRERGRVAEALGAIDGITVFPTAANFVTFRIDGKSSKHVFEALCSAGVLIRDVSSNAGLANCLRVSIGDRQQNDKFLDAMLEIMK